MDFELRAAKQKWEREQRQKKEEARARLERDRKAKQEAARRQEALEAAQRARRLEAAEAAQRAQRQAEEDRELGDGVRFNQVLLALRIPGDGDKLTLSAADFEALSSQNVLDKGPMFFEVSEPRSESSSEAEGSRRSTTHCGVLEFTAPEGFVGLPDHVWRNIHLEEAAGSPAKVRVRYVRLPKGNYAKLQPEGLDFADVPNHKAVLESKLRHHATLSEGELFSVDHGGVEYKLRVLELKPASAVTVLETDIEVDVVGTLLDASDSSGKVVPLALGKAEAGAVEEGKYRYYKFTVDRHLAEAASKGELSVSIRLKVDSAGSDADMYVARHPVIFPSRDQHQWSSHDTGTKAIHLTEGLAEGVYSISVLGFRGLSKFLLTVEANPVTGQVSGHKVGGVQQEQQQQEGYEPCPNCKQMIPSRTLSLHEAYCRRHNILCQHPGCGLVLRKDDAGQHVHCTKCGQATSKDELEKHMKVFHELLKCGCGAALEMQQMVQHKSTVCPLRRITCQFCGDIVEAGGDAANLRDKMRGLSQHESSCGSRTDACDTCHRPVMLKEMSVHIAAAHTPVAGISIREGKSASSGPSPMDHSTQCLVCGEKFEGVDAEQLMNSHLDAVHFSASSQQQREARRSLSVLCPICGMAVHSERDLSSHIDMVH